MTTNIKMRAKLNGNITEFKAIISHPMETGRRKNDQDELIAAHFIERVYVALNERVVLEAEWGTGISKNPYLTLHLTNANVGDMVKLTWHDNLGNSESQEVAVVQGY